MIGDLLLSWMSEVGTGSISDFRAKASWLARSEDLDIHENAPAWFLNDLASLGHCEVDWRRNVWSVTPPVITNLPLADGLAILVGSRRPRLIRAIDSSDVYVERANRSYSAKGIPAPETLLVPYEHIWDLKDAARALGASYVSCAGREIARMLQASAPPASAAPPARDSLLEKLTKTKPQHWSRVPAREPNKPDGLYREHHSGRWHYTMRRDGAWYRSNFLDGVYEELARRNEHVFRWKPDSSTRPSIGTVSIYRHAPLPILQARALSLCSGFAARYDGETESSVYDNVPRDVASLVASSLKQKFQVLR